MKVSICGCGWLGLPLAIALKAKNIEVWGSKTTIEGVEQLKEYKINSCLILLPLTEKCANSIKPFLHTDVLIIAIPPRRKTLDSKAHIENIMSLSHYAKMAGCQRVIFISTTSVYDQLQGNVTETTIVDPSSDSGILHLKLEQMLRKQWQQKLTVLRLSGLIGPQRHPIKFLAGRKNVTLGKQPVNLVHLNDCIMAIEAIILRQPSMPIMHLAASSHPSRCEYYTKMAQITNLSVPEFIDSSEGEYNKKIDASLTLKALGISLQYDDLLSYIPEIEE